MLRSSRLQFQVHNSSNDVISFLSVILFCRYQHLQLATVQHMQKLCWTISTARLHSTVNTRQKQDNSVINCVQKYSKQIMEFLGKINSFLVKLKLSISESINNLSSIQTQVSNYLKMIHTKMYLLVSQRSISTYH